MARGRLWSLVGIAVCLTAANTSPLAAQAPGDPCKVLTPAQIGAATGGAFVTGSPIGSTGCDWQAQKPANLRVTITFNDAGSYDVMKTPLPRVTKSPVSGVGDDAFSTTVSTFTTLTVKKGKYVFTLHVYGMPGESKQLSVEKALAANVIANL